MTTLVIGARGSIGRHVLDQLREAGSPVRASVRDLATAGDLPAGVEVVAADLTKPETLPAALDGVRDVFVYALADGAETFAAAAKKAGVEHVVLMSSGSVLLGWTEHNAISREHREVEHVLAEHGPRCTPVRPLVLASNALNWSWAIKAGQPLRLLHPDGRTAPVHERDIAAMAVAALNGVDGASDLLTGGELLSQREQAERIGDALGRTVKIEEITESEALSQFARFMPAAEAEAVIQFIVNAQDGGSPATGTVRRVLGREPIGFAAWAAEHSGDFQPR